MKLEVGMYVRTKEGNIEKICAIENEHIYTEEDYLSWYPSSNAISKASHNIIDLIEIGDYVNGRLVTSAEDVYTEDNIYIGREIIVEYEDIFIEEDIETIITKEMFESMQYEVK